MAASFIIRTYVLPNGQIIRAVNRELLNRALKAAGSRVKP